MNKLSAAIQKNDLFYHYVHGLCRVVIVSKSCGDQKETVYTLHPVEKNYHNNMKFHIDENRFENSGFNRMISVDEARNMLKFFKSGRGNKLATTRLWKLARMIYETAGKDDPIKAGSERLALDRALKALVWQLAFIFNLTVNETGSRILDNLSVKLNVNPYIMQFLSNIKKNTPDGK